ncbi:unnamed protein product [Heligmosomoides polygyrus]|uniref:Kinetochore protein NDC80 n=1 Tax=Heligmosomoides polygyrus TaxID=6339 RepID=A0A183F3Q7_HELPZ|nr:unnamed protein product [Heligmosomoides polygyrus]
MFGTDRKKSRGSVRWEATSSTMKTPTRPRFTIGGSQISSTTKNDHGGGQARFSVGGVPASARRHSVFRSITSNFKDTRPLSSREYQNEMIRQIYEFLLEHDGENCIPEKLIRSPTKQDFVRMFESIYQHFNPDFQLKNVLEEVPMILRELGYPTAIKPSTMQTIGASHSWPTLLGALTWMIEAMKNTLEGQAGQQLLLGGDDSSGTLKAYRYSWLNAGFKEYVQNRDAFKNESIFDNKIQALRNWYEQQEDLESQQQSVMATLAHIKEECAELEADKGNMDRLREDIARLDDDIRKATVYKEGTEQDVRQIIEELEPVTLEKDAAEKEVDEHREKLAEIERAVKAQEEGNGISASEARALVAELDQNKLTVRKLKVDLDDLCKQHWLEVPKFNSALAEQQERYRKLVMEDRNLRTIVLCEDEPMLGEPDQPKDAKALYFAAVHECRSLLADTEAKFMERKLELEQQIKQSNLQADNIRQEEKVISGKLRERQRMELRAERQRKRDREEREKDLYAAEADIDRLENEKEVLENKRHEIGSIKREIETLRAQNDEYYKMLEEKRTRISDAVLSVFHQVVSDLDMMRELREWMTRTLEEIVSAGSHLNDEGYSEK